MKDALWRDPSGVPITSLVLNFVVPFCVSTWSGAVALASREPRRDE